MSDGWFFRRFFAAGLSVLLLLLFSARTVSSGTVETVAIPPPTVILDAGHGGPDGGAIGVNGVHEKDLNLAMVLLLAELFRGEGVEVILTRSDDALPITEEQDRSGHRKRWDVTNRIGFTKLYPDALFVSIHMNLFPVEKYSGLQVWYAKTPGSAELAETVRRRVTAELQPDNKRQCKKADRSIRLLDEAGCAAILVECGFLSNRAECEKLCSPDYQRELSFSIFCAIMEYVNQRNGTESP
ncbi:MAG: N-acetylmuramoyl-L-alanine amidase [Clostridia bacterium]|nr:N-acetylmuramoyl-L-alanine amidase [Clostridia bacterium]